MFKALAEGLPDLLRALRRAQFEASTDQYLTALDLLGHLYVGERPPPSEREVRASLASIFCTRPEEQLEFASLFDAWFARYRPAPEPSISEPISSPPVELTWPQRFKRNPLVSALPWIAGLALAGFLSYQAHRPLSEEVDTSSTQVKTGVDAPRSESTPVTDETFVPPPRQPLDTPLPTDEFFPWWGEWVLPLLWLVPVCAWAGWMIWLLLHSSMVVRRQKLDENDPVSLINLTLSADSARLFNAPALEPFWRSLRAFRTGQSKRLDVNATVNGMLKNGGYFEPHYRERATPPAYLTLVDRRHAEDHAAEWTMAFVEALRREHVHVADLHYRFDPRHSRAPRALGSAAGPSELISLYPDHDLIVGGDGRALADDTGAGLAPWTRVFGAWPRKWLLSPAPLWPRIGFFKSLTKAGFRTAALSTQGLSEITDERVELAEDVPFDLPLPARLAADPLYWVQERGVSRKEAASVARELESYLGREGFLLLAAIASYPEMRWPLTRALDLQLGLDEGMREWRLRKLARLPWCRHAYMPDVIRYALFAGLSKSDIERVSGAFEALFQHKDEKLLHLPVAVPNWKKHESEVKQAVQSAPVGTPLADPVLAAVIRGRRPKAVEFALPIDWLNRRVAQDWRALWLPLAIGAFLLPASLLLNLWFWQTWAEDWAQAAAATRMQAESAGQAVELRHTPETRAYALSLEAELRNRGFKTVSLQEIAPLSAPAQAQGAADIATDQLEWSGEAKDEAILSNVRAAHHYITYGAELCEGKEECDEALPQGELRLTLRSTPRVFQDTLLGLGPDMVTIPGGCFQMGSPDNEPDRESDEGQHEVCVDEFMMSRFEVTFDEYDVFAEGTKQEKPVDEGWGRGRRPVINVSWEDASAYAAWLSEETGEQYRLPTEAEWEYAARAGSETAYWWGADIGKNKANCRICGSEWDGTQTAPVGSFEANAFGLYDTAGNVSEWTCSAYDENYEGGELVCAEASARGSRVLRGGAWYSDPRWLRSAYRLINYDTASRDVLVGFRLARAVR